MTYRGHIKNGQILLNEPVALPEGAEVNVEVIENGEPQVTIWDKLLELAGTVEGPTDWPKKNDHYLYGTPKRE
jgi:hypothetical protein